MTKDDTFLTTFNNLIASKRFDEALDYCEEENRWSEPCCQRFCGREYYVRYQYEKARVWFERLAQGGDPEGWFHLALIHVAKRDPPERALPYLREAADKGYGRANHWLGSLYESGKGVPKDEALALEWYRKGARYGFIAAQNGAIRLEAKTGLFLRVLMYPRLVLLAIKAVCMVLRSMEDERLIDIAAIQSRNTGYFKIDPRGNRR